jgi:hypothetical protein
MWQGQFPDHKMLFTMHWKSRGQSGICTCYLTIRSFLYNTPAPSNRTGPGSTNPWAKHLVPIYPEKYHIARLKKSTRRNTSIQATIISFPHFTRTNQLKERKNTKIQKLEIVLSCQWGSYPPGLLDWSPGSWSLTERSRRRGRHRSL